jgi:hypothetical protein
MDSKLASRLKAVLVEEGFAEIETESSDRRVVHLGRKGQTMAYVQVAEGVPAKGAPVTRYIPGPEPPVHDKDTRAPSVPLAAPANRA